MNLGVRRRRWPTTVAKMTASAMEIMALSLEIMVPAGEMMAPAKETTALAAEGFNECRGNFPLFEREQMAEPTKFTFLCLN